jgi:hypothetical protein
MRNDTTFPSADWRSRIEVERGVDGASHYHADVFRCDEWVCRIALAGSFAHRHEAEEALRLRLNGWLEDYEARPHTGDSGFHIL